MFNLIEIMQGVQGGGAIDNLARQYRLSPEQTRRAVDALIPAFTLALQRSLMNPAGFASLVGAFSAGRYMPYFDDPVRAFSREAQRQGEEAMSLLFGSSDMGREVAIQAATVSGIGTEVMLRMMPIVTAMMMAGLHRSPAAPALSSLFFQLAQMFGGVPAPPPAPERANPFQPMFDAFFGAAGLRAAPVPAPSPPPPPLPWEEMMAAFVRAGGRLPTEPAPAPALPKALEPPADPAPDPMKRFVAAGFEVQEQYLASIKSLFDAWMGQASPTQGGTGEDRPRS